MTATSAYAPIRRQSSTLSNSSTRVLRRSSSGGAVTAVGGGALIWTMLSFWRRVTSRTDGTDHEGNRGSARALFDALSEAIESNLKLVDAEHSSNLRLGDELTSSVPPPQYRKGVLAVLRWLINLVGGRKSKLGRLIVGITCLTKEILLRSVGMTSVLLTGVPSRQIEGSIDEVEVGRLLAGAVLNNGTPTPTFDNEKTCLQLVRRDRLEIEQVLNYWFGQASPDGAQKSLWMIASSSQELLSKVDLEISKKFRALLWDLFLGSLGYNSGETDELGLDRLTFDNEKLHRWTDGNLFGWQGKIAAIVVLDQMSRHIHRHDLTVNSKLERTDTKSAAFNIPEQQRLDKIAFDISQQLQNKHTKELTTGMIPLPMKIFGIMPLRHASTIDNLTIVQKTVESAALLQEEMDRMIRRFRKATNRRMAVLQDSARREGKLGLLVQKTISNGTPNNGTSHRKFDDEQILESFPFDADMSKAHEHVVIKTIRNFLRANNILESTDPRFSSSRKTKSSHDSGAFPHNQALATSRIPTAIVSLSGGVDSMVIASALAYIRDTEASIRKVQSDSVLLITSIHIDYANRPESSAEASYVERYSKQIGAKFVCRRIDEVTRGVTARDDYERIAREIRFDLYRQCSSEAAGMDEGSVGVMLGHHRGDLRENVISNAHKGCGPLDLSGMTAVSKNDGVNLFRPLLPLEKTCIFDYAHTFGVPYFKDTTPNWSTRGKLRNRLLPLLEEIYGEGSMDNLSSLAEESDDARALVQQTVMGPFMARVKYYPMGLVFETDDWKDCGVFFWKFVLRNVLHSAGRGMFSDKSVESFLDRIRTRNLKAGWLQCRKDYAVYMKSDGKIFVFHPDSFPFQKKDQYHLPPDSVGYDHVIKVGPWSILAEVVPGETGEDMADNLLKKKALESMEQLMSGKLQYHLQVPIVQEDASPKPLLFVKGYTKSTRPTAWKGFDLKVEQTLPLLGIDHRKIADVPANSGLEKYGKTVRVQLNLDRCL